MDYFDRVAPIVDKTIDKLAGTKFRDDPIVGKMLSAQTSIISSAYKRHGTIIEAAIIEGLRDSNRFEVWGEDAFKVSNAAEAVLGNLADDDYPNASLPYGDCKRTLQIDLIAYDHNEKIIGAYEIKRGNGVHDAGKQRSMKRDLQATQLLLKSYGTDYADKEVNTARSHIIFYYGLRSIPRPFSIIGDELDKHFGFPIKEKTERVNAYFQKRLFQVLRDLEGQEKDRRI
jgi:hypothetical protein